MTEKYGFSVVAPISITVPFSTCGKSASCCNLLNLCISSINNITLPVGFSKIFCDFSTTLLISDTPDVVAFSVTNLFLVVFAITLASEVLPQPGGPQK